MRFKQFSLILTLCWLCIAVTGLAMAQEPEPPGEISGQALAGTAFSYQGQLNYNGAPINGTCEFQFALYNVAGGGSAISPTETKSAVVSNGLFTIPSLDFGDGMLTGEARWLGISVRCPAGSGTYTSLGRQPLTPAPYALALPGLRTQQNTTSPNIIGGYSGNNVTPGVVGATISGGGVGPLHYNYVHDNYGAIGGGELNITGKQGGTLVDGAYATVGGGYSNGANGYAATIAGGYDNGANGYAATIAGGSGNRANGDRATVGGGGNNQAGNVYATISGGQDNLASGNRAAIVGGAGNQATAQYATIGGGTSNTASGLGATVPGGGANSATGEYSFAGGNRANALHSGAFVWNNATYDLDFASTGENQFLIRAAGGVGINTNNPIANTLTVNGRVIAGGGTGAPGGSEPLVGRGSYAGVSLEDRSNPSLRWVVYPDNGSLHFWNGANRVSIGGTGIVTIDTLGSAGSTTLCRNGSDEIATCSSSLRYKNNVAPLALGLEAVSQLHPVTFNWAGTGEPDLGLVAEEVNQVTPLLTTLNAAGQIEGVKYDRISAVLVKAVQEQQAEIAALQVQNASLEARIAALEQTPPANQASGLGDNVGNVAVLALGGVLGMVIIQRLRRRDK